MPQRRWTDEQLIEAVHQSRTLTGVMRRLGLQPGRYDAMRAHIARLGIDASHIRSVTGSSTLRPRSWSDEDLRQAVEASSTYAETMRRLG